MSIVEFDAVINREDHWMEGRTMKKTTGIQMQGWKRLAGWMALLVALVALLVVCASPKSASADEEAPISDGPTYSLMAAGVDDYPSNLKNAGKDTLVDPWLFYNRECTSFVAWRLNNDNGVAFNNYYGGPKWGNANNWANAARSLGIAVNSTPTVGSVAWWGTGEYGHVAWVQSVSGNNITIEEYNYLNSGNYNRRTIVKSSVDGFIHIKDMGNDKTGPTVTDFKIDEINSKEFTAMAKVTDPSGIKSVRYAVWTENKGQDELKWYDGVCTDGNDVFWVHVPYSEHKNEKGKYIVDIYADDNAGNTTSKRVTYRFDAGGPTITDFKVCEFREGAFTVMAKVTSPNGIRSVQYPTWTDKGGQDDIIWYDGHCTDGNDIYWAHVKFSEHKNEKGKYTIHLYAKDSGGKLTTKALTYTFESNGPTISDVKVTNVTTSGYTVTCKVTDATGILRVQFPTWTCAGGQDDIAANWTTNKAVRGTVSGGVATFNVKKSDHNNEGGIYRTHIYAYDTFGNVSNVAAPDVNLTSQASKVSVPEGEYFIRTKLDTSKGLDVAAASKDNQANIWLWTWDRSATGPNCQKFAVKSAGDGSYYLIANHSNKAVEVYGASTEALANVSQFTQNQTAAQRWYFDKNSDGTYTLRQKNSWMVMDVAGAETANGTNIQQSWPKGTNNQKFYLVPADVSMWTVVSIPQQAYTGSAVMPSPVVSGGGVAMKAGTDYTLSYKNNVKEGTATVTITGKGAYTGSKNVTFKIASKWQRVWGATAPDTMQEIAKEFGGAKVAVLTSDTSYKDALAASSLAGRNGGLVLMTKKGSLTSQTKAALKSSGVKTVYILGSTANVNANVEKQLKSQAGVTKIVRISAKTPSQRAVALAKKEGKKGDTIIIATQNDYRDALSISPYSYATGMPILYAETNKKLSSETVNYIKSAKYKKAIVVGGPLALPASVDTQLKKAGVTSVTRIAGGTAYATSQQIAQWSMGKLKNGNYGKYNGKTLAYIKFQPTVKMGANKLAVSTGQNWLDALAGGALCGKNRSVMLLADAKTAKSNYSIAVNFCKANKGSINKAYVLGGTSAVQAKVWDALLLSTAPTSTAMTVG